mgnify:CR=1 FL=1
MVDGVRLAPESGAPGHRRLLPVFRPEIFDWLAPGEDLIDGPSRAWSPSAGFFGYPHDGFWAHGHAQATGSPLQEMDAAARTPWKVVWLCGLRGAGGASTPRPPGWPQRSASVGDPAVASPLGGRGAGGSRAGQDELRAAVNASA